MFYFDFIDFKLTVEKEQRFPSLAQQQTYLYDCLMFISSLQGLVNRETPVLYINFLQDTDDFWLKYFQKNNNIPECNYIKQFPELDDLLNYFLPLYSKLVLWDENVPATSNLAATICGIEEVLPVRYSENKNSFYSHLISFGYKEKKSLVHIFTASGMIPHTNLPSTKSAKCDCYLYGIENYIKKGLCNDNLMAYMLDGFIANKENPYPDLDNAMLANHDYFIANKAFFFDLSPWGDEPPNDDKNQPLGCDYTTFKKILLAQYHSNGGKKITTVGGFTPWQFKYVVETTDYGSHGGVDTEWQHAEILSAYNCILDADAPGLCGMANASIFMHHPLKDKYSQNNEIKDTKLENKIYIMYYMGDYDSAAWLSRNIPFIWNDSRRGELPLAWPFNQNLSDRAPHVFDYVYQTKTQNDFFVSGDSGAGYLNPLYLLSPRKHSDLPDAMDLWIEHNKKYYSKFDVNITGFIINGHENIDFRVESAYSLFSQGGATLQCDKGSVAKIVNDTVFCPQSADIGILNSNTKESVEIMESKIDFTKTAPQFHVFRSVLCTPSYICETTDMLIKKHPEANIQIVSPNTFFSLIKKYISSTQLEK